MGRYSTGRVADPWQYRKREKPWRGGGVARKAGVPPARDALYGHPGRAARHRPIWLWNSEQWYFLRWWVERLGHHIGQCRTYTSTSSNSRAYVIDMGMAVAPLYRRGGGLPSLSLYGPIRRGRKRRRPNNRPGGARRQSHGPAETETTMPGRTGSRGREIHTVLNF